MDNPQPFFLEFVDAGIGGEHRNILNAGSVAAASSHPTLVRFPT
jgi:hypothetical protein